MAKKLTLGQKRDKREADLADRQVVRTGDRALNAIERVRRLLGDDGSVLLANEVPTLGHVARRSTGVASLDYLLGGGLPLGSLIEFGAPFSTGKTTLAIRAMAHAQRTEHKMLMWVALEDYSRRWMRQVGLWVPFSEMLLTDPITGEQAPADPYALANEVELYRMQELGIEDPYGYPPHLAPVYLTQATYGDTALHAVIEAVRTNEFSVITVDSLALAKPENWVDEKTVKDANDFDRSIKVIADYTARLQLAFNGRYDDANVPTMKGRTQNGTTVINLQQVSVNMGNQSWSPWAQFEVKGGNASKHNHHWIGALLQGSVIYDPPEGKDRRRVGHVVKMKNLKSKIGYPYRDAEVDFYTETTAEYCAGDIDVWKDCFTMGLLAGLITRNGNHYYCGDTALGQGVKQASNFFRENPEWYSYVASAAVQELCK